MLFGKAITFEEENLSNVAPAAHLHSARAPADSEFIEKLKSGNAEAFDVLVTRHSGDIYALLYRLTENPEEASDLTQETFLSAFRSIRKFRGDAELKTWLFRIAINESRNRFRWWKRRKRESTISLDASLGDTGRPVYEIIPSNSASPEDDVLSRERKDALENALRSLPEIFREAIILCDVEGLTYDEAARTLNVNIGTIKSRIARGREELRKRLKDF